MKTAGGARMAVVALLSLSAAVASAEGWGQISRGVYVWWPDGLSASAVENPLAFVEAPRVQVLAVKSPPMSPRAGFSKDFRHMVTLPVSEGTDLYGTGETAGPLRRNGRVTECWNTDVPGYKETDLSLYQSHPWVLAVRKDGSAFGVLASTTYRCRIDLRDGIEFAADGPPFPLVFIEGKHPQEVVMRLSGLTGRMELPPLWSLGYHQCRWSYMSANEGMEIAREFRKRHIPCDTIWFDIDYMDGFRVFTFDKTAFPDPTGLNSGLHDLGFKSVWMIDPGVKLDPGYHVYDSGLRSDVFTKDLLGRDVVGKVWPGECVFPDYTRPKTRDWWAALYGPWLSHGIDGVWNDMNEPSFFDVATKTMPEDAMHRGGGELASGPHAKYHNVYGSLMARATWEGLLTARPDRRPFVLTRAGYIGYQRYAATWTGDNVTGWQDLRNAIPMVLNLGLSGQPFVGPDLPGFMGDGPADPAERRSLVSRWFSVGSMLPFARGHASKGTIRKEPWSFGPEVEETVRKSLWRRSILMPYLYTQFQVAAASGLPVARPLFFADATDLHLRREDRAFLLGGDLAVAAKVEAEEGTPVLPRGWVALSLWASDRHLPELWLRPGSILPLGAPKEFIGQRTSNDLWLAVALDAKGKAKGSLYEDAGDGFGYRRGEFRAIEFSVAKHSEGLRLSVARTGGAWIVPERVIHVEILGAQHTLSTTVRIGTGTMNLEPLLNPWREAGPGYRSDFG